MLVVMVTYVEVEVDRGGMEDASVLDEVEEGLAAEIVIE